MHIKIAESTALYPLGSNGARTLLRQMTGPRAGRLAAVYQAEPGSLVLSWSDPPHTIWSSPLAIATGCSDGGFEAMLTADGDIVVCYADQASGDIKARPFILDSKGDWAAGAHATIYSGDSNSEPSAVATTDGLQVAWVHYAAGIRSVHVKQSVDGGAVWGTGPGDAGEVIHTGGVLARVALTVSTEYLYAVYHYSGAYLMFRRRSLGQTEWSPPVTIASGSQASALFDTLLRSNGRLAVAWSSDAVYFREFDGVDWTAVETALPESVSELHLFEQNRVVRIGYLQDLGTDNTVYRAVSRSAGGFSPPEPIDRRSAVFDRVVAYEASSAELADVTAEAGNQSAGDVLHPRSGAMMASTGDALFVGLDYPFRVVTMDLATPGVGGTVSYSYWDGRLWRAFTPHAGALNLTSSRVQLQLWPEYAAVPSDWQKVSVDTSTRFWVRIETTASFTTPPIGSMVTALSDLDAVRLEV